jgi:cytochrome P450
MPPTARTTRFPLGAAVTTSQLTADCHPLLARLREREPVSWLPALGAWLVTSRELALAAMRDDQTFTVDDPRFSTGRIVGASMLSTDGDAHKQHRDGFARGFRRDAIVRSFGETVAAETTRLLDDLRGVTAADLRSQLSGPLAARLMRIVLGLDAAADDEILRVYATIVDAVSTITRGGGVPAEGASAFATLRRIVLTACDRADAASILGVARRHGLPREAVVANAAVVLFGGVETTDAMIANALWQLLRDRAVYARVVADPTLVVGAVEESLRLEPAAAVIDRYATATTRLGGVEISAGELVTLSIAAANRDPAVFDQPDVFDPARANANLHLAFAQGPHVCLGMHLARLEAHTAVSATLRALPNLRLDSASDPTPRGLVFRKPVALRVVWDAAAAGPAS